MNADLSRLGRVSVLGLDVDTYVPHALHRGEVAWLETNCYADVLIEVLHAAGHEPSAGLGFTIRTDLEADQWTFYKQPHSDLETLYGVEINEINPWTSVIEQVVLEVAKGRMPLVEVDSWFLPDTVSTAYKQHHVKSTIAVETIDVSARRMSYFHNSGYFTVAGDDFDALFPDTVDSMDDDHLPPYIEIAKLDRAGRVPSVEVLAERARRLLAHHVAWMPTANPFERYRAQCQRDIEVMREVGPSTGGELFHRYAFAYYRCFGAAFSLAAHHLRWLAAHGGVTAVADDAVLGAADAYDTISATSKTLQLRVARAALTGKPYDSGPAIDTLSSAWQCAADSLAAAAVAS